MNEYLGHSFKQTDDVCRYQTSDLHGNSIYLYVSKCEKCNYQCYTDRYGAYDLVSFQYVFIKLTCDEMVIKNIIE